MPRPKKFRFISSSPEVTYFKPSGVPKSMLEEVILEVDELEAVKLADLEGLYQEDAAKIMNVSRQTFGNILVSAHKKIAEAIVKGRVLRIEGGATELKPSDDDSCGCGYMWKQSSLEKECPRCRTQRGRGFGRRRRQFN
ncbi:MAG: DUF134 domain-containing protein [bacterium]